jgi:hypothetical protein
MLLLASDTAMPHESEPSPLRQRLSALEDARRGVGEALVLEHTARQVRGSADAAIVAETRIAIQSDSDAEVERFARWLQHGQARLASAEAVLAEAADATTHRRAELALVRAAAQATAKGLRRRQHEIEQERSLAARRSLNGQEAGPDA